MKQIFKVCLLLTIFNTCLISLIFAQVRTKIFRNGIPIQLLSEKGSNPPEISINPPENFMQMKANKKTTSSSNYSNQFALPKIVDIDILNKARVIENNGVLKYIISVKGEEAMNMSIQFSKFILSKNAIMSIYSKNELTDSITFKENNLNNIWATRVYQGSRLTIELTVPILEKDILILKIGKVFFGYKQFGGTYFGNPGASATCNINVTCAAGNGWENERNSVALIVADGEASCSGTLIRNTCNTNIPYVLTAQHCLVGNLQNWVFQYQYWSVTCTPDSDWNEDIQFNGATLRANHAATDFALVEMNQVPHSYSAITYAGWNRDSDPATTATAIHHPMGDVMKISHDFDPVVAVPWGSGPATHWRATFDQGIAQHGSSGSALFDQGHRIVGQLHGNQNNICSLYASNSCWCVTQMPSIAEYGRFDQSWTGGGTNSTRLSNWLDPNNMNLFTTNTTNIADLIPTPATGLTILGKDSICSSEIYTVNVPTGTSVSFTVSVSPNSSFASYSASGNEISVTRNGSNIGTVKITATVTDDCGNQYEVNRTVYLGPIPAVIMGPYDPVEHTVMGVACVGEEYYFAPYSIDPTATYNWKFIPPVWSQDWEPTYLASGPYAYFTMPDTPRCYTVRVEKTNACGGTVVTQKKICVVECNAMRLLASPNPATSQLVITLIDEKEGKNKIIKQENIQIEFYNLNVGIKQKEWKYNTTAQRQFTLNIADIAKGMYVVKVTKGKLQATIKIIKD